MSFRILIYIGQNLKKEQRSKFKQVYPYKKLNTEDKTKFNNLSIKIKTRYLEKENEEDQRKYW